MPPRLRRRSSSCWLPGCARPNAMSWRVSCTALSTARWQAASAVCGLPGAQPCCTSFRPVTMVCSRLLKSWAMPPVNRPSASSFWPASAACCVRCVSATASATCARKVSSASLSCLLTEASCRCTASVSARPPGAYSTTWPRPSAAASASSRRTGAAMLLAMCAAIPRQTNAMTPAAATTHASAFQAAAWCSALGNPMSTVQPDPGTRLKAVTTGVPSSVWVSCVPSDSPRMRASMSSVALLPM